MKTLSSLFVLTLVALHGTSYSEPSMNITNSTEHEVYEPSTNSTTDPEPNDSRQVLHVLVTGPYPDPLDSGWDGGIAMIPAVRLAFSEINNRTDILEGYKLQAIEDDSGCVLKTKAINSFVNHVYYSQKQIVGLIGPSCSEPTLQLAPLLSRHEVSLIQIAPTATSPLIESLGYSTTFTIVASSLRFIDSFIALMNHNNWTKVITLYDDSRDVFRTTNSRLVERISGIKTIDIAYTSSIIDEEEGAYFPLDKVVRSHVRVVLLLMEASTIKKILCIAYHMNMLYPNYQWISLLEQNTRSEFETPPAPFHYQRVQYNCSLGNLEAALNGAIVNHYQLHQDDNTMLTSSNQTYKEYRYLYSEMFWQHLNEPDIQTIVTQSKKDVADFLPSGDWENAYYDAGWVLGMALGRASADGLLNISQYSYNKLAATEALVRTIQEIEFEGATGHIKFGPSKSVSTTVVISQLLNDSESILTETVLAYYSDNKLKFLEHTNYSVIRDSFHEAPIRIHLVLGSFIIIMTTAVTIITVLLQIGFIFWSNKRNIKATSPNLSHLIFSGCYLFALATFLLAIQQSFELESAVMEMFYSILCNLIMWCLLLGYSLIFGTVLVKIWRIYKLFKHFKNRTPGVFLKDEFLIAVIIIFLVIDIAICVFWTISYPWLTVQTDAYIEVQNGVPTVFKSLSCECENMYYLIGTVAAYKGIIAVLLLVFSILNRKVRRQNFSHTKQVNILVYSIILVSGVGLPLYFLLINTSIYVSFLVLCAILLLTVVMCCLMLFWPPVMSELKTSLWGNGKHLHKQPFSATSLTTVVSVTTEFEASEFS